MWFKKFWGLKKKDQKIATLRVVYDQEIVGEYDLLSSKDIKKVNFLTRLIKSIVIIRII